MTPELPKGTLYLVPTPLDFGTAHAVPLTASLPDHTLRTAARITHWVTENAKSTRAFLKRVDALHPLTVPLQAHQLTELPRAVHKKGDHNPADGFDARPLLDAALQGHDVGLVSEAGMPAIADPGSSVVRAAHALRLRVEPLVGPMSLMLALAASGMNGQHFAFVGYPPQDSAARAQRLRELEALTLRTGQTQILIETPYRNAALLNSLLETLKPTTRLAVCLGLTLPNLWVESGTVADWKKKGHPVSAIDAPAVFLIGR